MNDFEIPFNGDELIDALKEVREHASDRGKVTLRTATVKVPAPPPSLTPADIKALRESLRVSQKVFARMLNVSDSTPANWEKGRRPPSGAALKLLHIARRHPEVLTQ